jgi:SAM-dependent methyltransferase
MIEAIEGQLSDVRSLLEPMLPGPTSEGQAHPDTVPATIQYLPYLYRDWGWAHETDGENEYALAAVDRVLDGRALGRTLVLGAGGCRLAYDLHRRDPDAELVVLDVDPLLFAAAYAVTHGETLSVREANLEIGAMDQCSMEWRLSAPDGPVDDDRFHFILADGVDPPFFQNTFDTVLTPWFIDQGPEDMRDLISTIHLLLKGDGCWLNLGPLAYEPEIPAALRFSSDEVFDLARRAGFWLHRSTTDSVPYLVSKLNGRGKVEWVLAFAATKVARPSGAEVGEGPPDWLIFRHVPIPTFEGQPVFWSEEPVVQTVVSAIDGTRTLDDITRIVARQASRSGLSMSQLRQAVRQCLAGLHPACRTSEGPAG